MCKPVPGFVGYEASSCGSVRSVDRIVSHWRGGVSRRSGKDLKGIENRGYLAVKLSRDSKIITLGVHQVIAMTFIGPANGLVVNHINGVKTDNRIENLEYVTNSQNVHHAYETGLLSNEGESNGRAFVTVEQVKSIRSYPGSASSRQISASTGVPVHQVRRIRSRQQWRCVK